MPGGYWEFLWLPQLFNDPPNLVTDIVRTNGVAGNWVQAFLQRECYIFVYARLWRKSGVLTDLEFYEIRYSGKEAAFLEIWGYLLRVFST